MKTTIQAGLGSIGNLYIAILEKYCDITMVGVKKSLCTVAVIPLYYDYGTLKNYATFTLSKS